MRWLIENRVPVPLKFEVSSLAVPPLARIGPQVAEIPGGAARADRPPRITFWQKFGTPTEFLGSCQLHVDLRRGRPNPAPPYIRRHCLRAEL